MAQLFVVREAGAAGADDLDELDEVEAGAEGVQDEALPEEA